METKGETDGHDHPGRGKRLWRKPEPATLPPAGKRRPAHPARIRARYEAMPELKKAELIEGVVYMPSPVRHRRHSRPNYHLSTWVGFYETMTPGVEGGGNGTVRLDLDNEPQPDVYLMIAPEQGGQAKLSADDYVEGAPELVAEVASSSASYDLHVKLHVYRRSGVREYLVWRVLGQADRLVCAPRGTIRATCPRLGRDPQEHGLSRPLAGPFRPLKWRFGPGSGGGRRGVRHGGAPGVREIAGRESRFGRT